MTVKIAERSIGAGQPTYFIADIAASHDGSLQRAVDLIGLAAESGADAAKFQNFTAGEIVSDRGFRELGSARSHQASWGKSVFEVYSDASIPHEWTPDLKKACDDAGIHYFSAAYDFAAVDMLEPFVPAYKIGSGDIDWIEMVEYTASKGKPMLVATGASSLADVVAAVEAVSVHNDELILMQCNTNYTGSLENFNHIHLSVLSSYREIFPKLVLGLSDHTPGHVTTLGAIALGARAIEKHFTDDINREGPDHLFSMDPASWREMVQRSRELESAIGSPLKRVVENERETAVIQRRAVRVRRSLAAGHILTRGDLSVLRPATPGAITAAGVGELVGRRLQRPLVDGETVAWADVSRAPE